MSNRSDPTAGSYFYEPRRGHGLPHSPFKAIVSPRPIAWISTIDAAGRSNLAPYSFFNAICESPPLLAFSSAGIKDTVRNIQDTGEFVVNMVSRPLADQMNRTSSSLSADQSEFDLAGLMAAPSRLVKAPRVADAPASFECKLINLQELCDSAGDKVGWHLVMGEVIGVHIANTFLKDGLYDTAGAQALARCGYRGDYATVETTFEMIRPG